MAEYSTEKYAGMDIRANFNQEIILKSFQRILVPAGISFEILNGHEAQIKPRSELATKKGITVLSSPGDNRC